MTRSPNWPHADSTEPEPMVGHAPHAHDLRPPPTFVRTGTREAVEYFAANRIWSHKSRLEGRKPVRVHVARIEDVTDSVTSAEVAAS